MIFHKTLVNIRRRHGYTQEEFAKLLGCPVEDIVAFESNTKQATYMFVAILRQKLGLHSAPITETEWQTLVVGMHSEWKNAIDYADVEKAKELQQALEKSVQASFSPSIENYYYLYLADYYMLTHDIDAYADTMALLSQRTDGFGTKHWFMYHCLLGARAFVEKRYQDAIKAYKTAEALDHNNEWCGLRFNYGMGVSLTDRNYAARAMPYLKKAKRASMVSYDEKRNSRFDVYIDGIMAYNLAKLGRSDEALKILDKRLNLETGINSKSGIGYTHFSFGRVYHSVEDFDKAIESYDKALQYLDKGNDAYISCIHDKTSALIDSDQTDEAVNVAEVGLSIITDEYWKTMLEALKHSASLEYDPDSATYLKEIAIPKLQEYGKYEAAVYYYQLLSKFYFEYSSVEIAFKYNNLALEAQKKLHKELVEGDI